MQNLLGWESELPWLAELTWQRLDVSAPAAAWPLGWPCSAHLPLHFPDGSSSWPPPGLWPCAGPCIPLHRYLQQQWRPQVTQLRGVYTRQKGCWAHINSLKGGGRGIMRETQTFSDLFNFQVVLHDILWTIRWYILFKCHMVPSFWACVHSLNEVLALMAGDCWTMWTVSKKTYFLNTSVLFLLFKLTIDNRRLNFYTM